MKIKLDAMNNDSIFVINVGKDYDELEINAMNNTGTIIIQKSINGKTKIEHL